MKIYLVGGAVRDQFLGVESKDNDYVVVGSTPEEMIALGFKKVGSDFPVFLHPETGDEYALARTEKKTGAGYNGFTCEFSPTVTIEEDLFRRDLTINAMAMGDDGELIDPYGGFTDLSNEIIRHVNPDAFADDPVRVLRAARFAARYEFEISQDTLALMFTCVINEFDNLTPERVWKELEKGLSEESFYRMLWWLEMVDVFEIIKPFNYNPRYRRRLMTANTLRSPPEVKFSIVSSHFTKADFGKWKIPNTYSELSLVSASLDFAVFYGECDPVSLLNFIEVSGVLKSETRFLNVIDLVRIYTKSYPDRLIIAVDALKKIDQLSIIGNEKMGRNIKAMIRTERLRVISEVLL